jgi:hypothetical protein
VKGDRPRRSVAAQHASLSGLAWSCALAAPLAIGPAASASSMGTSRPVNWSHLRYPVDCDRAPTGVLEALRVPGTGNDDVTVVLLQCPWEDGSGSESVLSYGSNGPESRLLQVVLSTKDGWTPIGVNWVGDYIDLWKGPGGFSLRVAGARGNAPRGCLNVFATVSWRWKRAGGGRGRRSPRGHHVVGCCPPAPRCAGRGGAAQLERRSAEAFSS